MKLGFSRCVCGILVLFATARSVSYSQTPPASAVPPEPEPEFQSIASPVGRIEVDLGVPSERGARKLFSEIDFQRACQGYLWALPIVGYAEWQKAAREVFGARDTDLVVYESLAEKTGILTPNATTPYIVGLPDLSRTGPLVIDYPAGATAGGVSDSWQRPITDLGEAGPDQGKGGKYLIVGPGQETPTDASGMRVFQSPTFNVSLGMRALDPDPERAKAVVQQLRVYPLSAAGAPPATRLVRPEGKTWSQAPPAGFAYWERLDDMLQREPIFERDRVMLGMLRSLGFEKGKALQPSERQKKLLDEGALVGEQMAKANSMQNRLPDARYRGDSRWDIGISYDPSQEAANYTQVDERASYFYVAVGSSEGMSSKTVGVGQAYLISYLDKEGRALDGGKTYRLRVPADVPAKLFWSITVYDAATRTFLAGQQTVDRSSRQKLKVNDDGSVEIVMGPTAPSGRGANWIPTVAGKAWFGMFRLYGPLGPYFNRSWGLPDFEVLTD